MDGKSVVLIVGEETEIGPSVRALGFRPVTVPGLEDVRTRLETSQPAFVLINQPEQRLNPVILHDLSRSSAPIFLVRNPGAADGDVEAGSRIRILTRPVTDLDLEAAVLATIGYVGRSAMSLEADRPRQFPGQYVSEYAHLFDHSPQMRAIRKTLEEVADTGATILFRGESGVGKDLAARAVHAASSRAGRPFVKVNCAALPADLLESELFGHEKGAFTGAHRRKLGKFEFANHGTIFLDEIGELPLGLQAKLLHVVEDFQFSRIGGRELIRVDTRILAATNRNLEVALSRGEFREDLYYRLNVVEILLPPLRERREEIAPLVFSLLARFNRQYQRQVDVSPELLSSFESYSWPGNIRELENIVRRLVVLANPRQVEEEILNRGRVLTPKTDVAGPLAVNPVAVDVAQGLRAIARRAAQEAERRALAGVLERVRWNRAEAARILKVSYKTLLTKIVDCGLDSKTSRHGS